MSVGGRSAHKLFRKCALATVWGVEWCPTFRGSFTRDDSEMSQSSLGNLGERGELGRSIIFFLRIMISTGFRMLGISWDIVGHWPACVQDFSDFISAADTSMETRLYDTLTLNMVQHLLFRSHSFHSRAVVTELLSLHTASVFNGWGMKCPKTDILCFLASTTELTVKRP